MGPEEMMMYYLMQNGMGGMAGQQPPASQPAMANPQMVTMEDQLRRSAAAGAEAPVSYRGGVIPMMANGQMGNIGQDLARQAGPAEMGPGGIVPVQGMPQGKLGWMGQFGQFLDGIDPNMRLMMGMGGLQRLGRVLGGGA